MGTSSRTFLPSVSKHTLCWRRPWGDAAHSSLKSLGTVDQALIKEIEHFFVSYNETHGKKFKPLGCKGPHVARRSVEDHTKRKEEGR